MSWETVSEFEAFLLAKQGLIDFTLNTAVIAMRDRQMSILKIVHKGNYSKSHTNKCIKKNRSDKGEQYKYGLLICSDICANQA